MINLQNVSNNFTRFQSIKSVSLTIEIGEIHGIIGDSGASKYFTETNKLVGLGRNAKWKKK